MNFTMTSGNITAVGGFFFGSNLSGAFQAAAITVELDGGNSQTFTGTSATAGSFMGFTSDTTPINLLTVSADQAAGNRWPTANDFIVGRADIPEPASLALLGIPALAFVRMRRRA